MADADRVDGLRLPALRSRLPVPAAFALVYAVAVLAGRATRLDGSLLALVWPAAAVGFLWTLWAWREGRLAGQLLLLAGLVGALNVATGVRPAMGVVLGLANGVFVVVACSVVRRWGSGPTLRTVRDLIVLLLGCVVGSAVSGLLGATGAWLLLDADLPAAYGAWMLRNTSGCFVFAALPMLLTDRTALRTAPARGAVETAVTALVVLAGYVVVFGLVAPLPVTFFVLPLSMLVALRWSTVVAACHVLLAGVLVVGLTAAGRGPFVGLTTSTRVLLAQSLVGVVALVVLALALERDERDALLREVRDERARSERQATLLASVLETVDVAIVACDADGHLTLFNRAAQDFHGRDRGSGVPPADWARTFDLYEADGRTPLPAERVPLRRALEGEPVQDEVIVLAPHGRAARTLRVDGRLMRDRTGRRLGAVVSQTDITRLNDSEQEFRAAFEHGPTPSARVDRTGTVLRANAALSRLLARPVGRLVDRPLGNQVWPDDLPLLLGALDRPSPTPVELRLRRADGSPVWCEVTTSPLQADGAPQLLVQLLDVHQRKAHELLLEDAASTDPLTGLGNRQVADRRLAELASDPQHPGMLVALLDLDGFKAVNDTRGHAAGDAVLVAVAQRLRGVVRTGDAVVRLGGDEFLLLCDLDPDEDAAAVSTALQARIERSLQRPVDFPGGGLHVGVSVGTLVAAPGSAAGAVLSAVDDVMYAAKRARSGAPPRAASGGR